MRDNFAYGMMRCPSELKAVGYSIKNDCIIVTSVGSLGWNYITWYAAQQNASQWVVFPPGRIDKLKQVSDIAVQELGIRDKSATFFMPILNDSLSKAERLKIRDYVVFSFAHNRYLICMRKNSSWHQRINQSPDVDRKFRVEYPLKHRESWQSLLAADQVDPLSAASGDKYLIHWTRGTNGPRRGESEADYYDALTRAYSGNPRDGFNTLIQIIRSMILRGSGRMIKGAEPVISFTDANFGSVLKLIKYRNTLGHWNFEPYGIGFPQELLKSIGARCVSFGDKDEYQLLSDVEKPFYQFSQNDAAYGTHKRNWTAESEWRLVGDLDFESIIDKAVFIVPDALEADNLYRETGDIAGLKRENIHYLTADSDT